LQTKIIIGIIIGIVLVIGIGAFAATTSNEANIEPEIETESIPDEGKNFVLELSDAVTTTSP